MDNHAELFAQARNQLLRNPNATCSDCEHFSLLGCWQAAEELTQAGYPTAVVMVRGYMSAESCPSFERSDESKGGDSVDSWGKDEQTDAAYALKVGK